MGSHPYSKSVGVFAYVFRHGQLFWLVCRVVAGNVILSMTKNYVIFKQPSGRRVPIIPSRKESLDLEMRKLDNFLIK